MLDENSINWLKTNIHETGNNKPVNVDKTKPKFVKMYRNSRLGTWYKVLNNLQDGTEILVPATKAEQEMWNLR